MKTILIISKMIIGVEPTVYGFDDEDRLFKKPMSKRLRDNLNRTFKENNIEYEAYSNTEYQRGLRGLTEEYDLLLLSPYIVDRIDFNQLNDDSYYILSIDEFEQGKTDKIITFLDNLMI